MGFPGSSAGKESSCNAGDSLVPSLGPENPLQKGWATHSSVLAWRIPMNSGAWQAAVQWVAQSRT